ncbi:MAG: hypothetical protein WC314_23320 [Vulcanimicrobiota bacterium]
MLLLLVFLASSAPSLAISKTPYSGVSPLKAGHSNRIEANNNPVNMVDPAGLQTVTPDLTDSDARNAIYRNTFSETFSLKTLGNLGSSFLEVWETFDVRGYLFGEAVDALSEATSDEPCDPSNPNPVVKFTTKKGRKKALREAMQSVRPEASLYKGKKHGVKWTQGPARAKNTGLPQGQWSQDALEYANNFAQGVKPGRDGAYFDLPSDLGAVVHMPNGDVIPATRMWIRNNGTGTWHGYPGGGWLQP